MTKLRFITRYNGRFPFRDKYPSPSAERAAIIIIVEHTKHTL